LNLNGKLIVISGGTGALGVEIIKKLIEFGASVVALDIVSEKEAAKKFEDQNSKPYYLKCDASNEDECFQVLNKIHKTHGIPDIVCCHAGLVHVSPIQNYSVELFDELINVNLKGSFVLAKTATNIWIEKEHPGQLIFTSSWVHDVPWPGITPYAASKSGINGLSRGFARELASKRIRSNVIAPGIVAAGMAKKTWDEDKDYRARASLAIPLGHLQPTESVANAFAFLCSDMSSYMTGAVLTVDGGCSLYPDI
jgi:NAD(P)-dependent dehydrogenase (short-subunit alcohol dehydrogenase family)